MWYIAFDFQDYVMIFCLSIGITSTNQSMMPARWLAETQAPWSQLTSNQAWVEIIMVEIMVLVEEDLEEDWMIIEKMMEIIMVEKMVLVEDD